MVTALLAVHVLGAIGVGVVLLLPFLVDQPRAAHRALLVLRIAGTLVAPAAARPLDRPHARRNWWSATGLAAGLMAAIVVLMMVVEP